MHSRLAVPILEQSGLVNLDPEITNYVKFFVNEIRPFQLTSLNGIVSYHGKFSPQPSGHDILAKTHPELE